MKNKVSELMDGELDTNEAAALIAELKGREDLYDNWKAYHLIGDTLRDSSKLSVDISQSVSHQLKTEPAILVNYAPKYIPTPFRRKIVGLSIAASLVIMVTGWLSMHALQQPQQIQVADNAKLDNMAPPIHVVNHSSPHKHAHSFEPDEIEDYLYVHGEFSPGTATRGLASRYVRSVNVTRDQ